MIVNFPSIKLIASILFLLLFPFVQRQWFNLYLFNTNIFSFYSILYLLSGVICPIIIYINSINFFTYYNFVNTNRIERKKVIDGKKLLLLFLIALLSLALVSSNYLILNIDLFNRLFFNQNLLLPNYSIQIILTAIIGILLIFRKTRILIKKLILFNFILLSFLIWYSNINNILVNDKFFIFNSFTVNNLNYVNVFYLFIIELIYYFWSFISFRNNLSDWSIPKFIKINYTTICRIFIFHFFVVVYYSVLGK